MGKIIILGQAMIIGFNSFSVAHFLTMLMLYSFRDHAPMAMNAPIGIIVREREVLKPPKKLSPVHTLRRASVGTGNDATSLMIMKYFLDNQRMQETSETTFKSYHPIPILL